MVRKFPPFRSERKKRSTSEGTPQFPFGISGKLPYHLTSNQISGFSGQMVSTPRVLRSSSKTSQERLRNQATFLTEDGIKYIHEKGFTISKTIPVCKKWRNVNHFVFPSFYFGAKNGSVAFGMAASLFVVSSKFRRVSPGRIIVVSFWTKYAFPREINPEQSS